MPPFRNGLAIGGGQQHKIQKSIESYFRLIAYCFIVIFNPFSLKQWFAFNLHIPQKFLSGVCSSAATSLHSLPKLDDDVKLII